MPVEKRLAEMLELCGFGPRAGQEPRLVSVLMSILRLQEDPPIALEFKEIYEQIQKDDPSSNLTTTWVHRLLKRLVDSQLVRLESPDSRRKRYIADVNTVMAGLERIKSAKLQSIESEMAGLRGEAEKVSSMDCKVLAQQFVEGIMGREQKISSRIVRGKEELHRVVRYNMLDLAGEGDVIRATVLWLGPFIDEETKSRTDRFVNAARKGTEVRYMVSTDIFKMEHTFSQKLDFDSLVEFTEGLRHLRGQGVDFDVRLYQGQKTYNQISFNRDSMVLIIAEDPVTATWITRDFNPDLIDNAVLSFDKAWESGKSFLDLTLDEVMAFGVAPGGPISRLVKGGSDQES